MAIDKTTGDTREHLTQLREDLTEFIFGLAIGSFKVMDAAFNNKLMQTIMAHKREIQRRLDGEEGSQSHYDNTVVCGLMANLLLGRLLDHFESKRSNKEQRTAEERAASRFLAAALKDFDEAQRELASRFPYPEKRMSLSQKFYWHFYNVTRNECEHDAAEILTFIAQVEAEQTQGASAA